MQYNIVSAYRWYSSNMFLVLSHDLLSTVVSLFHYSRQGFIFHAHSLSPYQNHGPVFHLRQVQHTCKTQNSPHLKNTLAAPLSPLGCTKSHTTCVREIGWAICFICSTFYTCSARSFGFACSVGLDYFICVLFVL